MSISTTLLESHGARSLLADKINNGSYPVGGVYQLDYSSCTVLTDDYRKKEAGGIPKGGFLLAAACKHTPGGFVLDDEEIILLRVTGTAPLPNEADLVQTRLAVVRDATDSSRNFIEVTDELTRAELQQSAFACEVIGTFYTLPGNDSQDILFGADIDNVYSSARYQVFLPSADVLSWLCSYPQNDQNENVLTIGKVRFASTMRRAIESKQSEADVNIVIEDFISRKTAVFGMTRTGKSNTIKTIVTAIADYSARTNKKVGQLIFDPQGEYANINEQDKTGLRLLGEKKEDSSVRIYRLGKKSESDPQVFPLEMNFYDSKNFEAVVEFVNYSLLSNGNAAYLKSFASIDWAELSQGDYGDLTTLERAKIAFYGLLYQYGIKASSFDGQGITFVWDDKLYNEFIENNKGSRVKKRGRKYVVENPETASKIFKFMVGKTSWDNRSDKSETPFKIISEVDKYSVGKAAIRGISDFHSENSEGKVEEAIWRDMESGVISIVDLSLGDSAVTTVISEKIVNHLLAEANSRFRNGHEAVPFQIIVEEAHNLFERGAKDTISNPWVRLSKEAAKYKIGLIYATQEVTSVDSRILANTSNWLVAHLNSDKETRELSHYYDYKTWAESLRRIEDQGFVRMKTYSGKYIVPVQINKFDHSMINKARESNGLAKIEME